VRSTSTSRSDTPSRSALVAGTIGQPPRATMSEYWPSVRSMCITVSGLKIGEVDTTLPACSEARASNWSSQAPRCVEARISSIALWAWAVRDSAAAASAPAPVRKIRRDVFMSGPDICSVCRGMCRNRGVRYDGLNVNNRPTRLTCPSLRRKRGIFAVPSQYGRIVAVARHDAVNGDKSGRGAGKAPARRPVAGLAGRRRRLHAVGDGVVPEAVEALERAVHLLELVRADAADLLDGADVAVVELGDHVGHLAALRR